VLEAKHPGYPFTDLGRRTLGRTYAAPTLARADEVIELAVQHAASAHGRLWRNSDLPTRFGGKAEISERNAEPRFMITRPTCCAALVLLKSV
jgi:hypothetical protein